MNPRYKEPSSWAGIAAALSALAQIPVPGIQPYALALSGIAGAVAYFLREGK